MSYPISEIRTKFFEHVPQEERTPNQINLIQGGSLAISDPHKEDIRDYFSGDIEAWRNDRRYHALNQPQMELIAGQINKAVLTGQIVGGLLGAGAGAMGGASVTFLATTNHVAIIAGGVVGGVIGGISGVKKGGELARNNTYGNLRESPQFRNWRLEKLDSVISTLAEFAPNNYPQPTCPITGAVMRDPVRAPDGYVYEREAIIAHLDRQRIVQENNRDNYDIRNQSPFRICGIERDQLVPTPYNYQVICADLLAAYNQKVTRHLEIQAMVEGNRDIELQNEEERAIVRFYQTPEPNRRRVAAFVASNLVQSAAILPEEEASVKTFLERTVALAPERIVV